MRIIEIEGVGAETAKRLNTIGIRKTEDIKDWREIAGIRQIGVGTVAKILNEANIQVFIWEIEEYRNNTRDVSKTELASVERNGKNRVIVVPKADINDEEDENEDVCLMCGDAIESDDFYEFDFGTICDECYSNTPTEQLALAEFLECNPDELKEETYDHWGLTEFEFGNAEYAIGTDDEADEAAGENIRESVWAFNAWFIASHVQGDVDDIKTRYDAMSGDFYNAIELAKEIKELKENIEGWEDEIEDAEYTLLENDGLSDDKIEDLKNTIADAEGEIDTATEELKEKEGELEETDFDEDVDEEDYSWENEFFDELMRMGITGEAASNILLGISDDLTSIIEEMQQECEDANDALTDMIDDMDAFIEEAISTDGRGHLLSGYDGCENEVQFEEEYYYIYRTN